MTFPRNQHLVFMPGLDGTGKSFEPLLPYIAPDTRVTIVRYPTDKFLSFEDTVEWAAAQIPGGHPPVVIAESFSGPVAVQMIASGRVKARALVLCATFARSPHPVAWRVMRFLRLPLLIRPDMPGLFFKFVIGNDQQIAALLPLWKKVHTDVPPHVMASRLALINNLNVTQELKKLTIPCCYLQAMDDRIVPSRCLKDFDRNIPHLYIKKIKAPHFILQAEPQACLAAVSDFLQLNASTDPGNQMALLKQQMVALQKNEAFFRAVTQESLDITITVNTKAVITYVNPSIEIFLGYKPEELIGKSGFDYIVPDDMPRALLDFGKSLLTREVRIPNAFQIRHKDGSIHILEGVGVNLLYNPAVKGFVMNVRDITDRRKMEEELEASRKHLEKLAERRAADLSLINVQLSDELAQRKRAEEERRTSTNRLHRVEKMESLGNLAGGIAHELNNILGVQVGYTGLMMMKMPNEDPLKKYLHHIMKSSEKAAEIIQDMLILARRGVAVSEVVNLNNILTELLQTREFEQIRSCHPRITFKKELAGNLLNIQCSPAHLAKTLMNLIANAVDAVADEGKVAICTGNVYLDRPLPGHGKVREGDYVALIIRDNGQGIPPADIDKIFEPFYMKKVMGRSGTGLGLAVAWATVRDHQGYIDVQSEPGRGSTFTIYLPATREALKKHPQTPPLDSYMGKGESVLVVDDRQEQREVAADLLAKLGYTVQTVSSGEEAVAYLKNQTAAVLVLDMLMEPGIDGLETYKRILKTNPGQKAVIVSGYTETDRVRQALDLGASSYIRKPYLIESIGTAIRRALQAAPRQATGDASGQDRRKHDRRRPDRKES